MRKRYEREMQKINVAYEMVRSFLSSQQKKDRKMEAQAKAKTAPEAKAKAASRARAIYRKMGIRKVVFAVSALVLCSLLIMVFTIRDQKGGSSKHLEGSRLNPNDAKVYSNRGKGQGERASSSPISLRAKEARVVPKEPESSKPERGTDEVREKPFERGVAALKKPELSKLEAGMTALKEERFAESVTLFEEILADNPSMMKKVSEPYSRALQGQASELLRRDPNRAKTLLLAAVKLDQGSIQGHYQLGLLYVREKDYAKAIDTFQKAAALNPQSPETFFNLAYVYAINKDYSRAEEMYGRVVELAPPFLDEALFNLAIVHEKLGKREESIKNLEQAITVNPENELAKKHLQRLKRKWGENQ
jgi:tetratricopeptide (TPR) repeat protein